LLFAARLLWDKGIQQYVDAARMLRSAGLHIEFLVAGSPDPGNPASVPAQTVQEWRDEGLITPLGHVEDMVHWLHRVDVAVLPSYREGLPKSLIEAAACGLPIITTDAPGCREIVEHGVNGLLVPCRDAQALADAIRFMVEHPDERARMGAAGREKVLREFDESIFLARTLDVYRELTAGSFSTLGADPIRREECSASI
jgi:glycosyltransferase involved in cell wall biosynthesis